MDQDRVLNDHELDLKTTRSVSALRTGCGTLIAHVGGPRREASSPLITHARFVQVPREALLRRRLR